MSKSNFHSLLKTETARIDSAKTSKRHEKIITGFTSDSPPRALIGKKEYRIFNSNDYLGLRFNKDLEDGEISASKQYGTGPGAVRFISGTLKIYKDLENSIAKFHGREDAIVFSSAFAANLAVIFCLIRGQSKDTAISDDVLVISDELNHRSIIDGIRVANLPKEKRLIYKHLDVVNLKQILKENSGKFKRILIITDGIFSMLGEVAPLAAMKKIIDEFDSKYEQGIHLIVDDSHGVGSFGQTGRGVEEAEKAHADLLVGTFGKAFGADGGYAVGKKVIIDYLRESAATYIYSNSISPGVAGAALAAVNLTDSTLGRKLIQKLAGNIDYFKQELKKTTFELAVNSRHPIQPVLLGSPEKTKDLTEKLFQKGVLVTPINYPVVPLGRDEIRVQISASHTTEDIKYFMKCLKT